ncbi:hypothetical protein [Limnoglobus roseus]|nr:hypothetical protein [Limnoglobus roseus]
MTIPARFLADSDEPAHAFDVGELILMLRELPPRLPVEPLAAFNAGVKLSVGETVRSGRTEAVLFLVPVEEGTALDESVEVVVCTETRPDGTTQNRLILRNTSLGASFLQVLSRTACGPPGRGPGFLSPLISEFTAMYKVLFALVLITGLGFAVGCNGSSSASPAVDKAKKEKDEKVDAARKEENAKVNAAKREKDAKVDEAKKEADTKIENVKERTAADKKAVADATTADLSAIDDKIKTLGGEAKKNAEAARDTLKKSIDEANTAAGGEKFKAAHEQVKSKLADLKKQVGL